LVHLSQVSGLIALGSAKVAVGLLTASCFHRV